MSVRSLGRLTLDLVLQTGNFLGPMDKAGRSTKRRTKAMADDFKKVAQSVTAVAAASAAGATALVAITDHAAQNARELRNQAQMANASVEEFQRMAYGVKDVGIEQDKLSDILKDVNDRIGDFIATGGGPMADFFENIAPKVGLTADAFRNLSGPQALQLYYDSLEKANLSQEDLTFYLEAMASDTTALIPLLRNGGERLGEMADEADQLGIVLSDLDVAKLSQVAIELDKSRELIGAAGDALAVELAPFVLALAEDFSDAAKEVGDMQSVVENMVDTGITYLGTFLDAIWEIDRGIQTAGVSTRELALVVAKSMADATVAIIEGPVDALNFLIEKMNALPGVDIDFANQPDFTFAMREQVEVLEGALRSARIELDELAAGTAPSERLNEFIRQAREAADAIEVTTSLSQAPGDGNNQTKEEQEAADEAAKSAAKAAEAINKQVASLEQQAATLGMAEDATKLYALAQEGANDTQLAAARAALETIASYEESEQAADDYKSMLEDLRTKEEEITDQVRERMAVLDAANVSANEYAEAMEKISAASVEDAPEFGGIDASVGGASGELLRVAEAEKELEEWYSKQLDMQNELLRTKEINEQTHADRIAQINQQNNERLASIQDSYKVSTLAMFSSLTGDAADMMGQLAGEGSDAYKALFLASKAAAIAQTMVSTEVAAAKALELGPIAGIPAASLVRGLGYASVGMIAATTVSGMAHDGIDSVPETGTWLLEKGERVTTAETSAKLDATLARLERDTPRNNGGEGGGMVIHAPITVEAKPGVSAEESRRQGQQMGKAFRAEVLKIMQNEKRQGGLLSS